MKSKFLLLFLFLMSALLKVNAQKLVPVSMWYDAEKRALKESFFVLKKSAKILDSTYISYFSNGKTKATGNYKENQREGLWQFYYENGNLRMSGHYIAGMDYGVWDFYFESGTLSMQGSVIRGVKEGKWQMFYENENLKQEGFYLNGKKDGMWRYYNEDGHFKAKATFSNDKGKYKEIYPSEKLKAEGEIKDGKSTGLWKYYYENEQLKAEGEEREGIKEGMWKYYHPKGNLMSEGIYTKGRTDGHWKYYFENGNLSSEGPEKHGLKDGYWKLYYKNGTLKGEGNFIAGNGDYKEFYESGKLKVEGKIKNDKNEGQWHYYHESGALEGSCFFISGEGYYKSYYENGKIKMEGTISDGNKSGVWKLYKEDGTLAGYYRNYYENDTEAFRMISPTPTDAADTLKKESAVAGIRKAKLRRRKSRYFSPKINEFRSIILATNPLGILVYRVPFSVEYYFQERLGYEIGGQYYKEPFLTAIKNIPLEDPFYSGFSIYLRQKFYQPDQDIGMFYFGHEIRLTNTNHSVKYQDTTILGNEILKRPNINQYILEYSILLGNRIMGDAKKKGLTVDMFLGIGIGYRLHKNSWQGENTKYNELFKNTPLASVTVPIRFGIMVGYALGKSQSR